MNPQPTANNQPNQPTIYREWSHAPSHLFIPNQAYIVTCGTLNKAHILDTPKKRSLFQFALYDHAEEYGWQLEAWAILSNHYHLVAQSPENPENLEFMLKALHSKTAIAFNEIDGVEGRQVWFQCWDTCLTDSRSYFARLHYVHHNPAHHGVVPSAVNYPWCSMGWFIERAGPGFRRTVLSFKIDKVNVPDDYSVLGGF